MLKDKPVSDTSIIDQQRSVPRYANEQKRAARKTQPRQFIHRITICVDDAELECLTQARQAFRSTEAFLVRMALDTFLKSQGLMAPNGFPVSNGGSNG
jgi:hypothetical protein